MLPAAPVVGQSDRPPRLPRTAAISLRLSWSSRDSIPNLARELIADIHERRNRLRREFARLISQNQGALSARDDVRLLSLRPEDVIGDPLAIAQRVNRFAGCGLDTGRIAAAVDRSLHRNRRMAEVS